MANRYNHDGVQRRAENNEPLDRRDTPHTDSAIVDVRRNAGARSDRELEEGIQTRDRLRAADPNWLDRIDSRFEPHAKYLAVMAEYDEMLEEGRQVERESEVNRDRRLPDGIKDMSREDCLATLKVLAESMPDDGRLREMKERWRSQGWWND